MVEPPYGVIWNRIKSGKVIPFLGAGASFVGRPSDMPWDPNNPQFLPSGRELSQLLKLDRSTTYRVLLSLEKCRLVEKDAQNTNIVVNYDLAKKYESAVKSLAKEVGIVSELTMRDFIGLGNILQAERVGGYEDLLDDLIDHLNEEIVPSKKDEIRKDKTKWTNGQKELVGIALGRTMAHEVRHLARSPIRPVRDLVHYIRHLARGPIRRIRHLLHGVR